MNQVRTSARFISAAVVVALVAITVLTACGVAFAAPMGDSPIGGSSSCAVGSHGTLGVAGVSAETPRIAVALAAVVPSQRVFGSPRGVAAPGAGASTELPPPVDPRHGRIRV